MQFGTKFIIALCDVICDNQSDVTLKLFCIGRYISCNRKNLFAFATTHLSITVSSFTIRCPFNFDNK
jgi:hypothetical protein